MPAARALLRWQRAAGPYWPYVCAAPFLGAETMPPTVVPPRRSLGWLRRAIGEIPVDRRPAILIDGPAHRILVATPELNRQGLAVVPVIQRWVEPSAVLRSERLVAGLIAGAAVARWPRPDRGVVFVLDGERAGPAARSSGAPRVFDNRYAYPVCRFPPPSFFRQHGIDSVWWLSTRGATEDLAEYREILQADGLPVLLWDRERWCAAADDPPLVATLERGSRGADGGTRCDPC